MALERYAVKLTQNWQYLKMDNKIMVILYFMVYFIGSPAILSILIPTNKSSLETSFSISALTNIDEFFSLDEISTITLSFNVIYLFFIFVLGFIGIIGESKKLTVLFCIVIVLIDLFANVISFYMIKAAFYEISVIHVFFCAITAISTIFITMVHHKILIGIAPICRNQISHRYDFMMFLSRISENLLFVIRLIIVLSIEETEWFFHFYYITLMLINGSRLYSLLQKRYFLENTAHYLHIFVTIICSVLLFITQLYLIFQTSLLEQNFFFIIALISLFAMVAFHQFNTHKFQNVILMETNEIINSGLEIFYLDSLKELHDQRSEKDMEFIVTGFCQVHSSKEKQHHILTNENSHELEEKSTYLNTNRTFRELENNIKKVLDFIILNSNNENAIQECLLLKVLIFQDIFTVHTYLELKINLKKISLNEKLSATIILNEIKSLIKTKNREQLTQLDINSIMNHELILKSMKEIIVKDLNLKSQKWKQLCNNICKSREIEENISEEIENILNFDHVYCKNKTNYKNSHEFQSIAFFYFGSVVFQTKKCQEISKTMKTLFIYSRKTKFTTNEEELISSIFTSKHCFFELDFNEKLNEQPKIIIKNLNKNALKIFNCKERNKIIGNNLLKFIPDFLTERVNKIICEKIKENKGRIFSTYLVDWEGHAFEVLVSFRVVFLNEHVTCLLVMEQKTTDNLVLLDSQGFIQSIGKTYENLFTSYNYHKLHFSTLFSFPKDYESLNFNQCEFEAEYIKTFNFIDVSQDKEWWINHLESIKKWTDSKNELKEKKKSFDFQEYCKLIRKQREHFKEKDENIHHSLNDDESSRETDEIPNSLNIELKYKKCKVEEKYFYVVELRKIEKQISKRKLFVENDLFLRIHEEAKEKEHQIKTRVKRTKSKKYLSRDQFNFEELSSQENIKEKINDLNIQYGETSTNNSMVSTLSLNRPLMGFSEELLSCPNSLFDKRLVKFTAISILFCLIVAVTVLIGYLILSNYLLEERQLMEINCLVSDNFQLAELLYNSAITYNIYQRNYQSTLNISGQAESANLILQYFDDLKISYYQQRELLMRLITADQVNFDQEQTVITGTHYYQFLNTESKWRGLAQQNGVGSKIVKITEKELKVSQQNYDTDWIQLQEQEIDIIAGELFMLYNVHSNTVINSTTDTYVDSSTNFEIQTSLSLMKVNFLELKRLNHYNIHYYSQLINETYHQIYILIFIFSGIHVAFTISILILTCIDKNFREKQKQGMTQLYSILPPETTPKLYQYFTNLSLALIEFEQMNSKTNVVTHQPENFNLELVENVLKLNELEDSNLLSQYKENKKETFRSKGVFSNINFIVSSENNPIIFRMLIMVIIVNFFFIYGMEKLNVLNNTIVEVVSGIGELMDAENYLLESYFDLKANFVTPNPRYDDSFFSDLMENQQSVDVIFNKIALHSLEIFTEYDPEYASDFVDLLRNDLCEVIKEELNEDEWAQCIDSNQMQYFDNGIALTMNYVTRKIHQTIISVQLNAHNYTNKETYRFENDQIFMESEHRDINVNLFYIFRMFQFLQNKVNLELSNISDITIQECETFIILEILIIGMIFPAWVIFNYKKQKNNVTKLYLSLLLLNEKIVGESSRILQNATNLLEFENGIK